MKGQLAILNGNIITMDKNNSFAQAVVIKDGYIQFVGSNNEAKSIINNNTETIDLKGKTLLPGFIDSHVHLVQTGLNTMGVNLSKASCIKDVLELMKKRIKSSSLDSLLWGVALEEENLTEKRFPTRYELDTVTSDKPLFVSRVEYHTIAVNSHALHLLNLPFNLEGIEKDSKGLPSGILQGRASSMARKKLFEKMMSVINEGLEITTKNALSKGITTIVAMEGGFLFHDLHADHLLKNKEFLSVDIEVFYQTTDINKVIKLNLPRIGGCIFLDGSFGSRTAALKEPYWDERSNYGTLYFTQDEIDSFVLKAHKSGLQITVHAIGDMAIEQILDAYAKALKNYPRKNHRHRIEHFEIPTNEQILKAKELGIVLSVQPGYEYLWGEPNSLYDLRLGVDRRKRSNPYKTLIKNDLLVLGGSDSDVTPLNPFIGIHGAVNHPVKSERLNVFQAMQMYTLNGAKGIFQENIKGTIEKKKIADLVVVNQNPFEISKSKIKDLEIEMTIKKGKILYTNNK